jgi:hypothetical protein
MAFVNTKDQKSRFSREKAGRPAGAGMRSEKADAHLPA